MKLKILTVSFLSLFLFASPCFADKYGVYVKVIEGAQGSFDKVSEKVEGALRKANWRILASYDTGVPEKCEFRSRVIIFSSTGYENSILSHGPKAAFALPLRVGVYEDDAGINVALLNPVSINRTIIDGTSAEEKGITEFSQVTMNSITNIITKAVAGNVVNEQMGEIRSKGRIDGTYGGDFVQKIKEIYKSRSSSDTNFKKIAGDVKYGILNNKKGWRLVYTLNLFLQGVVIYGITKEEMEANAFSIIQDMQSTKQYTLPVLYYNTAFPIELIVYREGGNIKVVALDEMYRMNLYFLEIQKWKLIAKYFMIPGQIEEEIEKMATDEIVRRTQQ